MDKLLAAGTPQGRTGCTWTLGHSRALRALPRPRLQRWSTAQARFPCRVCGDKQHAFEFDIAQTQHTFEPFFVQINMPNPGECARLARGGEGPFFSQDNL